MFAADAFFKAAISRIPELPRTLDMEGKVRSSEPLLVEYLNNLVSTLLITPVRVSQAVWLLLWVYEAVCRAQDK